MSRRADPSRPGMTAPMASTEVRSTTTTTTTSAVGGAPAAPPGVAPGAPAPRPALQSPPDSAYDRARPSAGPFSEIRLAPATRTSVTTTTTVTTVHFAPILIPRSRGVRPVQSSFSHHPHQRPRGSSSASRAPQPLTPKSSFAQLFEEQEFARADPSSSSSSLRLDPKMYPLSQAPWPGGMKKFRLALGKLEGTFYDQAIDCLRDDNDLDAAMTDPAVPLARDDKGKGKERAASYSLGALPAGGNHLGSFSIPLAPPPRADRERERGAHAQRRRSRRSRPFGSLGGDGDGVDDLDDDIAPLRPPRMSLDMDSGVDMGPSGMGGARLPSPGPPRKRARAASHVRERSSSVESDSHPGGGAPGGRESSIYASLGPAPAATLPSPHMSPPSPVPTFSGGDDSFECLDNDEEGTSLELGDPEDLIDLGSGKSISALLSLPDFVNSFDGLSPQLQSYFIFTFLKRSSIPVLQTINNIIAPSLRRDFLTDLPPELGVQILGYLDAKTLCRASVVCKGWRRLVDGEWRVWKERLSVDGLWIGNGSEEKEAREIAGGSKENLFLKRWKAGVWDENSTSAWSGKREEEAMHIDGIYPSMRRFSHQPVKLASPSSSREASPFTHGGHFTHPFKTLYRRRFVTRQNWAEKEPARVTFACHANNVVTCLQFDKDKVVSASDDHSINVFDTRTGATKARLSGHEGGVWALQYIGNILVSGSTDRTVRIWDLATGKCTHVFVGHTSTVRCLQIVEPENINPDPNGEPVWEPPYPLIVTGSRDWSLRVWKLPSPERDAEYHPAVPMSPTEENTDPTENPYHLRHLAGHRHAVRALAAHGRTLVSGSYDCQVRVWDILTGECKHRLTGHSQKVYSVVYDHVRKQCASGSMDGTVRLWSTETGECKATLEGHSSLVGLLGLSYRNLVSAAADSTLRIWDPATGACRHTLAAHSGAITCFQHDENKVISGSDGTLKMWNVSDGSFTRDLLTGLTGVWQVSFDERFCVAAVQRNGQSEFEILDFGPVDDEEDVPSPLPVPSRSESDERIIKAEDDDDGLASPRLDHGADLDSATGATGSRPPAASGSRSVRRAASLGDLQTTPQGRSLAGTLAASRLLPPATQLGLESDAGGDEDGGEPSQDPQDAGEAMEVEFVEDSAFQSGEELEGDAENAGAAEDDER